MILLLLTAIVGFAADGSVKAFKVDLTNGNLLTPDETKNKTKSGKTKCGDLQKPNVIEITKTKCIK